MKFLKIYIYKLEDINSNYQASELLEIFQQVVNPDLSIFGKFIEGIIKVDGKKGIYNNY